MWGGGEGGGGCVSPFLSHPFSRHSSAIILDKIGKSPTVWATRPAVIIFTRIEDLLRKVQQQSDLFRTFAIFETTGLSRKSFKRLVVAIQWRPGTCHRGWGGAVVQSGAVVSCQQTSKDLANPSSLPNDHFNRLSIISGTGSVCSIRQMRRIKTRIIL